MLRALKRVNENHLYALNYYLTPAFHMAALPWLSHRLSADEIGQIYILATFSTFVATVCLFASNTFLMRAALDKDTSHNFNQLVSLGALIFTSGLFLFLLTTSLALFLFSELLAPVFSVAEIWSCLALIAVDGLCAGAAASLRAKNKSFTLLLLTFSQLALISIGLYFLVEVLSLGVVGRNIAYVMGSLVFLVPTVSWLRVSFTLHIERVLWERFWKFARWSVISNLYMTIFPFADRLIFALIMGTKESGVISVAFAICNILALGYNGLVATYEPVLYSKTRVSTLASRSKDDLEFVKILFASAIVTISIIPLVVAIFPSTYAAASEIVVLLVLSVFLAKLNVLTLSRTTAFYNSLALLKLTIVAALSKYASFLWVLDQSEANWLIAVPFVVESTFIYFGTLVLERPNRSRKKLLLDFSLFALVVSYVFWFERFQRGDLDLLYFAMVGVPPTFYLLIKLGSEFSSPNMR